jgi:ubiquinone/menaquinone biosynthesis C-methylase UbiE
VWGVGVGRFLAGLIERNPEAEIDYVDLSVGMQRLARTRAGKCSGRVRFTRADARTDSLPGAGYDLIVTHFFLDCFDEADAGKIVRRIVLAAQPKARWLVSEFRQPESGWRAAWAHAWLRALYLFFRITTGLKTNRLIDHRPLLQREGFRLGRTEHARFGLLISEIWIRERAPR